MVNSHAYCYTFNNIFLIITMDINKATERATGLDCYRYKELTDIFFKELQKIGTNYDGIILAETAMEEILTTLQLLIIEEKITETNEIVLVCFMAGYNFRGGIINK